MKMVQYREAQNSDFQAVTDLVLRLFDKYIEHGFSSEGQSVFRDYCKPNAMLTRLTEGTSFYIVAISDKNIIGIIEIRNMNHIALLFVDDRYHKNGIGKNLVSLAFKRTKVTDIDVHSSIYAVNIYEKMGFIKIDNEQVENGIRYIPMKKSIVK